MKNIYLVYVLSLLSIVLCSCGGQESDPDQPPGFDRLDYRDVVTQAAPTNNGTNTTQPATTNAGSSNAGTVTEPATAPVATPPVTVVPPFDPSTVSFPIDLNDNQAYWTGGRNWNTTRTEIYGANVNKVVALMLDKKVAAKTKAGGDTQATICSSTAKKPRAWCLDGPEFGNALFLVPLPLSKLASAKSVSFSAKYVMLNKNLQLSAPDTKSVPTDAIKLYYAQDLGEIAFAFVGGRATLKPAKNTDMVEFNYTYLKSAKASFWDKLAAESFFEIQIHMKLLDSKKKVIEEMLISKLKMANLSKAAN